LENFIWTASYFDGRNRDRENIFDKTDDKNNGVSIKNNEYSCRNNKSIDRIIHEKGCK
jgi:hypothetical protein